jgi:23S rRNA pseudouridine1911/1915/1917 synthase
MARDHITTAETYLVTWTVEPGEAGQRLDHFLKEKYRKLSRGMLQKSIREGQVTLNHRATKPSQLLKVKDKVFVLSEKGQEPDVDFRYKVLFEDEDILVVNKPGNLPVHPSGRFFFHTLLTQLRVKNGNEVDQRTEFYVVHRIDRETSGVLVLAKNAKAAAHLVKQFEQRKTKKEYLAIVKGVISEDRLDIDAPLARDPHSEVKLKMHVVEMGAQGEPLFIAKEDMLPSRTLVEVVERLSGFTLVRCFPHTGRQHQIRVHLFHKGYPIAGDKLYGVGDQTFLASIHDRITSVTVGPGLSLSRHALHAHRLSFTHPETEKLMEIHCPLPPELDDFLQHVR